VDSLLFPLLGVGAGLRLGSVKGSEVFIKVRHQVKV